MKIAEPLTGGANGAVSRRLEDLTPEQIDKMTLKEFNALDKAQKKPHARF